MPSLSSSRGERRNTLSLPRLAVSLFWPVTRNVWKQQQQKVFSLRHHRRSRRQRRSETFFSHTHTALPPPCRQRSQRGPILRLSCRRPVCVFHPFLPFETASLSAGCLHRSLSCCSSSPRISSCIGSPCCRRMPDSIPTPPCSPSTAASAPRTGSSPLPLPTTTTTSPPSSSSSSSPPPTPPSPPPPFSQAEAAAAAAHTTESGAGSSKAVFVRPSVLSFFRGEREREKVELRPRRRRRNGRPQLANQRESESCVCV